MGVLEQPHVKKDIGFARGTTFRWGWRCGQRMQDGTLQPIDLSAATMVLRLYTLDEQLLVEKPAQGDSTGRLVAQLDPSDTNGDRMRGRRRGVWQVLGMQPHGEALSAKWREPDGSTGSVLQTFPNIEDGDVTLYGWGYWLAY